MFACESMSSRVYVCVCYFEVMRHSGVFSEGSVIYCLFLPWHWDNTLPLCSSSLSLSLRETGGRKIKRGREYGRREGNGMARVEEAVEKREKCVLRNSFQDAEYSLWQEMFT